MEDKEERGGGERKGEREERGRRRGGEIRHG